MNWTPEQIAVLQEVANKNKGHCDRCGRIIKVYKYGANKQMAIILRRMAHHVAESGKNEVDFNTLQLPYALGSQRTKMRLHGLIAKVKATDGKQKASTWLITNKGGDWLHGKPIMQKVIVFDNQVLGHEGAEVTIQQVSGEPALPEEEKISTGEAGFLHNVRQPVRYMKVMASYNGGTNRLFIKDTVYDLVVEKLQVGKPVVIIFDIGLPTQWRGEYKDINQFRANWHILKNGTPYESK